MDKPGSEAAPATRAAPRGNVYLIGPMGSGKTTVGQRVAQLLDLEFLDCDQELESRTGASVALIFDVEGEAGFRDRETRMLEELTARRGVLLATGGGVVLSQRNRELLRRSGLIVYLSTSVGQQIKRLRRDRSRPLIQTSDRRERLKRLAEERNPLYEELADIDFPSRDRSPDISAQNLAELISKHLTREDPGAAPPDSRRANH